MLPRPPRTTLTATLFPYPTLFRSDAEELAEFPTGPHWRVAEAPLLRSVEAVARIGGDRVGPVLADIHRDVAWWLLPPDLTDELDDMGRLTVRSEEHTSELQAPMRTSYAVFFLKKKKTNHIYL